MPSISTSTTCPGCDRARVGRGAGEQDVAGLERHEPRGVGDLVGRAEDEVGARVGLLDELAVDVGPQPQVVGVDVLGVDEHRAQRAEPVLALDAQHRPAVGVAEVVDAPVVGDGVAADVAQRVRDGGPQAALADDDGQLALVVQVAAAARACHGRAVGAHRRRRLEEEGGRLERVRHRVLVHAASGSSGGSPRSSTARDRRGSHTAPAVATVRAVGQRDDVALDGPLARPGRRPSIRGAPHGRIASLSCWATTSPPSTV